MPEFYFSEQITTASPLEKGDKGGLKNAGFSLLLRVTEGEVLNDLNNVIRAIEAFLPEEILNDQSP